MMMQPRHGKHSSRLIICAIIAFSCDAHAYIDPGTGSYVLQLILAGFIGAAFTAELFWKRLKMFTLFAIVKRKDKWENGPANEDE